MHKNSLQAKKLGREPTPIEVFTYTHTKDHDLNTFVDKRAVSVNGVRRRGRYTTSGLRHHSFTAAQQLTLLQPAQHHSPSTLNDIRAQLADQQRQIAELRAHVMRLSGEQGAGTSSSDPAPATDRHVSTSQQQPLPSPDLDAVDDTLVTPPGATSHPAGTPPGDPTSGDPTSNPADEQQHRFDFGPFYFFICILIF
ncbi:hypothetical protein JCGZ_04237 [Jatropha curcas]|uniref:Uncharacterized protein n=1 Tax=Jatropha curcas TaxID=180498 RepID=A0A067KUM1_JATCU|nr:hypothetical protein JCGZ_04237 [Jatropha curcas]